MAADPARSPGPDLLDDPLFSVAADTRLSLPDLLAHLLTDGEVDPFARVAVEQRGHWWRFLVRCAARALRATGRTADGAAGDPADALAESLRGALAKLAPDGAWKLHQPDPAKPGFLQVPLAGRTPADAGYAERSVATLTGLLGGKNHERKSDADRALDAERVVYALIEYQGGAVFGGRGNYASQLMGSASGAGSGAPFVGAWVGNSVHETFRHDVRVMMDDGVPGRPGGDTWALWTLPWDGAKQLRSGRLDPAFIPLARRVRLAAPDADGRFHGVWFAASTKSRIVEDHAGNLGDPFLPIVPNPQAGKKGQPANKARGTLSGGYDYREVARLLIGGGGERPPPSVTALAGLAGADRPEVRVRFEGVAYAQGKTEGVHRREVRLPYLDRRHELLRVFGGGAQTDAAREIHTDMLGWTKDAKRALSTGLRVALHGRGENGALPRPRPEDASWLRPAEDAFEARVDAEYVDHLLRAAALAPDPESGAERTRTDWNVAWGERLQAFARDAFHATLPALPRPTSRRMQREVEAEDVLNGLLRALRRRTDAPMEDFDMEENDG